MDTAGDTETDSVLKGVVRSERLESPEDYVEAICNTVKREHIAALYGLAKSGEDTWSTPEELLEKISLKCGRLRKGGEPCLRSSAIMLINDYQRGRLPHYVAPPELKDDGKEADTAVIRGVKLEQQNLDGIERSAQVEEAMGSENAHAENASGVDGEDEADDDSEEEEDAPVSLAVKGEDEWD